MNTILGLASALLFFLTVLAAPCPAADDGIAWLVEYDGAKLPDETIWTRRGQPKAKIVAGALHIEDASDQDDGCYRASWKADPNQEIVVEARVKVGGMKGYRGSASSVWPWRDGAPIGLLVSDGRRQEGLVLTPSDVRTFTDRFYPLNTTGEFHDYRLVIRGTDMSVFADGRQVIQGQDAFWKPADAADPFIQFGSSAKAFAGDSYWQTVRLGVRKPSSTVVKHSPIKVTLGQPWEITRTDKVRQTRPYLYDLGRGLLLMSIAQGPDAFYEPYGVLKSTDEGQTWTPIKELDQTEHAPLPMMRLADGTILGVSRWCRLGDDGVLSGRTVRFDSQAERFTMVDNKIHLPPELTPKTPSEVVIFERHMFENSDGSVTVVAWTRLRGDKRQTERKAHFLKSADGGKTWHFQATIMPGGEPAVAQISDTKWTAVIRSGTWRPLQQSWSGDNGKTWSEPMALDVGCVDPDIVMMSNGVLACSYGRPASCLMFSVDQGKTWCEHRVISDKTGYNYTSIREISPGRLLYVHDAPTMQAVYVDVELTANP